MKFQKIIDKKLIEAHFRKNIYLNLYQIGDLDDFFWKYTDWYAVIDNEAIEHIVLQYTGTDLPVILALCDRNEDKMKSLLYEIKNDIPDKFYSHMSKGVSEILKNDFTQDHHGHYLKMSLNKNDLAPAEDLNSIRRLTADDLSLLLKFYEDSYPGNWFDKRMLDTGKYFGYFIDGKICGVSGIHVYSPVYKVAALGNIATDPSHRGKSICANVTSVLCADLFETVDHIGLNVHSENHHAIRSYEKVGFRINGQYEEIMFYRKGC